MARPPVVLALRALGLGDFLTGVPAYRALRRAYPGHEVVLAAPGGLAPLAPLTAAVDRVHATADLSSFEWPDPGPDVAVNLHGRGPQSHRALTGARPGRLVAFGRAGAEPVPGPEWRADEHEVHRWCRLLVESGIAADPGDLRLARPDIPSPVAGAVVVHPGAAYGSRRWPVPRYAAVARALAAEGHRVVVTGSAQERGTAEEVGSAAGLPADGVLAGRTGLLDLSALVADADLVICGDTGLAHLATAYGTASVVLFGPVSPGHWGPPALPRHTVLWHGRGDGDPWGAEADPALLKIGVDEVLAAARRTLTPAVAR